MTRDHTPTPTTISISQINHVLKLYPKVIQRHYTARLKDSSKVAEAVQRDQWRYDGLHVSIRHSGPGSPGEGIDLGQLGRLVQWKITHGHSRPFLPSMIKKNEPETVKKITEEAAVYLAECAAGKPQWMEEALASALKAMDVLGKLYGVGPATSSLVCSVMRPDAVPFFEDEMLNWLSPGEKRAKLKYDKKEYKELFAEVSKLKQRFGGKVSFVEIEKVAFVLEHWDLVDEKDKDDISNDAGAVKGEEVVLAKKLDVKGERIKDTPLMDAAGKKNMKRGTPKPDSISKEDVVSVRRSKRIKK